MEGFEFYLDAFRELSTSRPSGFSAGSIPFTAMSEYFTIYDIDGDFDEFAYIIRRIDNVYLELEAEDMKASQKGSKSGDRDKDSSN